MYHNEHNNIFLQGNIRKTFKLVISKYNGNKSWNLCWNNLKCSKWKFAYIIIPWRWGHTLGYLHWKKLEKSLIAFITRRILFDEMTLYIHLNVVKKVCVHFDPLCIVLSHTLEKLIHNNKQRNLNYIFKNLSSQKILNMCQKTPR